MNSPSCNKLLIAAALFPEFATWHPELRLMPEFMATGTAAATLSTDTRVAILNCPPLSELISSKLLVSFIFVVECKRCYFCLKGRFFKLTASFSRTV